MSTRDGAVDLPLVGAPSAETMRLRRGAVGIGAVLFMALATAAPITAMVGNTPIVVGYGIGRYAPAGFLVATGVLFVFTVGYAAMARHVTSTGAFYGFIAHGLGPTVGLAAGVMATTAYVVFEASLIGIFSYFSQSTVLDVTGLRIDWIWFALAGTAVIGVLGYFDIELSGRVLGVFLVSEVLVLLGVSLAVLLHGGGPQGLVPGALNPLKAFSAVPGGSVGIALFFCFWSWVGYETCAVYGEESTDPTRIVPRSVLIAVLAVGALYVFVSWMAVAGNGPARAVHLSRTDALQLFFGITRRFVGVWAFKLFEILIVTGSFACALAFHNTAARYLYALGREAPGARVRRGLGSTHRRHQSPHVASLVQSAVTLGIVAAFFAFSSGGAGPVEYVDLYGLMAILGTALVLICQTLCSLSVVAYFHVRHEHPETASWWRTLVAPLVGAAAMAYVVYLLFANLSFAAGAAASSPVFAATPWIVLAVAALGLVGAEVLRRTDPARHARIGRTVLDTTAAAPGARRTADASPGEVPAAVPGASTG